MKKLLTLLLIQAIFCVGIFGQNTFEVHYDATINPAWEIYTSNNSNIIQTADGGYLISGGVYDITSGYYYALLIKTDNRGFPIWLKTYSDNLNSVSYDIINTNDGGYILLTSERLFKLNQNGDSLWSKPLDGFIDIEPTNDDGFVIGGYDYILKFNAFGDTLWSKNFGLMRIKQTYDSGFIGLGQGGIVKLDSIGDTLWTKSYNGINTSGSFLGSIQQTSDGGYIFGGSTSGNLIVMKLNTVGDVVWAKTYGGGGAIDIQQTFDDGFIMGRGGANILRIDSIGNVLWDRTYISPIGNNCGLSSLKQTSDGGVIFVGYEGVGAPWSREKLTKTDANGNICLTGPNYNNVQASIVNITLSSLSISLNSPYTFPSTNSVVSIDNFNSFNFTNAIGITSPPICLISVDSTSTKNKVVWEKPITQAIDSFMVYREFGTGNYGVVGSVPYDSLTQFYDNTVGVNPNITSYRYKISAVDTCGNESQLTDFHETMHLSTNLAPNGDINLIWDAYEGFPVTYYRILRDSTFSNNWEVLDSVSNSVFIWTDINPPTNGADYVIDVIAPFGCTSTKAQDHNSTRSNRANILGGGVSPGANFTANFTQINIGGTLDFLDQSINNPTSWTWQFPGGSPAFSTQQNPSGITYNTVGLYDVTLIVSNANGLDTLVKTNYIEVLAGSGGSAPACDFLASATQVPEGTPVDFLDLTLNSPTSWTWLFPGGNPAFSTDQSPIDIYYNTAGTYDVTLITSNGNGTDTLVKTNYIEVISTIGVQEYKEGQVGIYPNPANNRLTVELTQIELPCFFALKDMQGRTVYNTVVNAEKLEIDLSAYAKGIYLIRINNDKFSRELKLVKQ